MFRRIPSNDLLVVFTFPGSFRFLLTLYARLLVMLSLTYFLLDTGLCAVPFETTKSTI